MLVECDCLVDVLWMSCGCLVDVLLIACLEVTGLFICLAMRMASSPSGLPRPLIHHLALPPFVEADQSRRPT
jgi:hypothetical protein